MPLHIARVKLQRRPDDGLRIRHNPRRRAVLVLVPFCALTDSRHRGLHEAAQLRLSIEAFAAVAACRRLAAGADPDRLREALRRFDAATRGHSLVALAEADVALHGEILRYARVPGLPEAWQAVFRHLESFHRSTLEFAWPDVASLYKLHEQLVGALCSGSEPAVLRATEAHAEAVWYRGLASQRGQSASRWAVASALRYLNVHYDEPLTLEFVARRVCGISPSLLGQLLRARCRRSFTDTLMEIRLERAAQLLAAGRNSVHAIAQAVGYADPSRFCELFKRRYRVTPGRYCTRLRVAKVQTNLPEP